MSLTLQDDHMCYVCGKNNPAGLKLDFLHPKPGLLTAVAVFSKTHQGYKDIVHGGMISMVLDEMMINLAWKEGKPVVTAELTVRLRKPVPVKTPIHFEGRIDRETSKVLYASALAKTASGDILATASASCVRVRSIRQNT